MTQQRFPWEDVIVRLWKIGFSVSSMFIALMAQASETWLPVKDVSLIIEAGSVLDFSALNSRRQPITTRLIVNPDGHFAEEGSPQKPLRFLMGSLGFGVSTGSFPSHTITDMYVRQFRMHGYNMARLDFIEDTLMHERQADFDFNPEQFDRLHYLLAALKREGIYYILNGLSSGNAAYGNIKERWINQRNATLGIYFNNEHQKHWQTMMQKLFTTINPYTGISTLNDPALAGLIMVNEGGLAFTNRNKVADALRPQFADWLKKKYGSTAALATAWKGELTGAETIEAQSVAFPRPDAWTSQRMADTQEFFVALETTTANWMTQFLRHLGYKGMVTAYNNWLSPAAHVSRGQFDWVDMHNYFSEPTNDIKAGSIMRQDSLLTGSASYIRELAAGRHIDKAFTVTEFGQVFWNKNRRESALAVATYAAFQGWDAICQHATAVNLSYAGLGSARVIIGPFNVGLDPIARAGETLAALLYLRGDVSPAQHMLGIKLTPRFVFADNAHLGNIPGDVSRLSLVTGIGLDWVGRLGDRYTGQVAPGSATLILRSKQGFTGQAERSIRPKADASASKSAGSKGSGLSKTGVEVDDRWVGRVDALRQSGLIDKDNLTNAHEGTYQTDTGEIILDSQRKRLMVVTPKTEAVVFDTPEPIALNNLTVQQADGPALVSVSAMDGQALSRSQRMLVIVATDARNTDMRFNDAAETTLLDLGKKPVMIRAVTLKLMLKNQNAAHLKVLSITLRGKRGDAILVTQEPNGISFVLDTASLSHGPTTYFEISTD